MNLDGFTQLALQPIKGKEEDIQGLIMLLSAMVEALGGTIKGVNMEEDFRLYLQKIVIEMKSTIKKLEIKDKVNKEAIKDVEKNLNALIPLIIDSIVTKTVENVNGLTYK